MKFGFIYIIIDHYKNKVYIGQKIGNEIDHKNYYGSGSKIKPIIKKRKHHLQKIILGYCNSQKELNKAEKICINHFHSNNPIYGYNLTEGGNTSSGYKHTNESKEKMSKNRKGYSAWNSGLTKYDDDRVAKYVNKSAKTQKLNSKYRIYISPNKGKFGKFNKSSKQIVQKDLYGNIIKYYDCIIDAATENNFSSGNISSCCHKRLKQAYGYIWEFL